MIRGARIMIVENSWDFSAFMRDLLTLAGYTSLPVIASVEDAVGTAENSRPDIVLIDAEGDDRLDSLESGEDISERVGIPVIFITGHKDDDMPNRIRAKRLSSYLVKPFDRTELKAAIEIALYKHRTETGAWGGGESNEAYENGNRTARKFSASGINKPDGERDDDLRKEVREFRAEIYRLNMEIAEYKEIIASLNMSLHQLREDEHTARLVEEEAAPPGIGPVSVIQFQRG
jgi:DNA-binding response OmpR family regulator